MEAQYINEYLRQLSASSAVIWDRIPWWFFVLQTVPLVLLAIFTGFSSWCLYWAGCWLRIRVNSPGVIVAGNSKAFANSPSSDRSTWHTPESLAKAKVEAEQKYMPRS